VEARVEALLDRLWREGEAHDAATSDHGRRMLHITPDTGRFLALMVRLVRPRRILEIGTSDGYSTLWLAEAARDCGASVTTVERSAWKAALARQHLEEAGLRDTVDLVEAPAGEYLAAAEGPFEFVFLDADRPSYGQYTPHLARLLSPGGLWVTDNAVSHAHELAEWFGQVDALAGWQQSLVPVGKGEHLLLKPGSRS
jgi:predicted O-methyltransferase YrrM